MDGIKFGLPPIARPDARLFILGSLPGDASLTARRYYAHPTNQFWRLLGHAIGDKIDLLDYDERLRRLAERRIGLWDVIASASRRGSLDQADLKTFSDSYSKPLDHVGMRENELVSQMQDQMESTLAELMRFIAERG